MTAITVDYTLVGAGSAGCVLANRLVNWCFYTVPVIMIAEKASDMILADARK